MSIDDFLSELNRGPIVLENVSIGKIIKHVKEGRIYPSSLFYIKKILFKSANTVF